MGIFLNETYTSQISGFTSFGRNEYLSDLCESLNINTKAIENRFSDENAGMAICYESEVAWNTLMEEMKAAEFTALHEGSGGGFWAKIGSWAKAIIAFFVKIWKAIVAWIKRVWAAIVSIFVTSDEELRKKLVNITSAEDVEKELNTGIKAGDSSATVVTTMKTAVSGLLNKINSGLTAANKEDDDTAYKEKLDAYVEKTLDKEYDDALELLDAKDSVAISKMDCLKELKDFDKRMKPLIEYLKDTDKIVTAGTKAAETAKKAAEKESGKSEKTLLSKDANNATEYSAAETDYKAKQKTVRNAVTAANLCRKEVNRAISLGQKTKQVFFANHNAYRAAAKQMISASKKKS